MEIMTLRTSNGYEFTIDVKDFSKIRGHRFFAAKRRGNPKIIVHKMTNGKRKEFYLHRFIVNARKGEQVIPLDGNYLNCIHSNLKKRGLLNIVEINNSIARIRTGNNYVYTVDIDDLERVKKYRWLGWIHPRSGKVYIISTCRQILLHRLIIGAREGYEVDHKNRNGLDNRRCNLRECTSSENSRNGTSYKGSSSKYRGVSWDAGRGRWAAALTINYKRIHLGRFESEIQAALAYDEGARKYFGEFASYNFPGVDEQSALAA